MELLEKAQDCFPVKMLCSLCLGPSKAYGKIKIAGFVSWNWLTVFNNNGTCVLVMHLTQHKLSSSFMLLLLLFCCFL